MSLTDDYIGEIATDALPCPFCGARAFWDGLNQLCCNTVECQASLMAANSQDEAISMWNRRAPPPAMVDGDGGEVERLKAENAALRDALTALVASLSSQDDEGLIEHAAQMIAARAALSLSREGK